VFWANTMSDVLASEAEQASARAELFHYFRHLAALRRSDPQDDVASALVHAEVAGQPMNEGQLDAFFILLTVAGNETTRNLLSMGLEQLCLQQDDLARLRANPDLIPLTVEEMVRWVSPVIQMRRTATCDLDLHGTPIKAGDKVVLYFAAANRDERQFEAADRFRIDRTPNEHVGFGIGPHFCLGTHLARLETAAFLEVFLSRYQSCAIEGLGERLPSNWFAALKSLSVRWS
jgi:cytochrome P450